VILWNFSEAFLLNSRDPEFSAGGYKALKMFNLCIFHIKHFQPRATSGFVVHTGQMPTSGCAVPASDHWLHSVTAPGEI